MPLGPKREPRSCFVKFRPVWGRGRQNWRIGKLGGERPVVGPKTRQPTAHTKNEKSRLASLGRKIGEEKTCQLTYEATSGMHCRSSAGLRGWVDRLSEGTLAGPRTELRHPCALPTPSRIRRHIFTIGLWQLLEHGAERRASSAGPVVLDPGVRARALRPHRQLRRVGLLLDPAELRGRGTGCANSFWPPSGRRYCEVLSSDVGGRPGNAIQHSLRMPAGPRESDANGDLHQQVARALTAGANRAGGWPPRGRLHLHHHQPGRRYGLRWTRCTARVDTRWYE